MEKIPEAIEALKWWNWTKQSYKRGVGQLRGGAEVRWYLEKEVPLIRSGVSPKL